MIICQNAAIDISPMVQVCFLPLLSIWSFNNHSALHIGMIKLQLGYPCMPTAVATALQSVEGMKVLCFELMEASGGRASASTLADLAASANELVVELTRRVHQVR